MCRALLSLGRLKRKYVAFRLGNSLLTVSNGNNGKARFVLKGAQKGGFNFGARDNGGDDSETDCEVVFREKIVQQVGEAPFPPEPEEMHFLHRMNGRLTQVGIKAGQSLQDWHGGLHGSGDGTYLDGYFTTKGGKLLNPSVPVKELGLGPEQEVVWQSRLRGGGYGGEGKGARGGGANSAQAGDWTFSNCSQPGCWNTRYSCYRCGAPSGHFGSSHFGSRPFGKVSRLFVRSVFTHQWCLS